MDFAASVEQDEQMKPGRYERVSTLQDPMHEFVESVFLRAAQSPGSQLSVAGVYARQAEP